MLKYLDYWQFYTGNRGVHVHMWSNSSVMHLEDLTDLTSYPMGGDTYSLEWFDGAGFEVDSNEFANDKPLMIWTKGFFIPPADAVYQFYWTVDGMGMAYFSETGDPEDKVKI